MRTPRQTRTGRRRTFRQRGGKVISVKVLKDRLLKMYAPYGGADITFDKLIFPKPKTAQEIELAMRKELKVPEDVGSAFPTTESWTIVYPGDTEEEDSDEGDEAMAAAPAAAPAAVANQKMPDSDEEEDGAPSPANRKMSGIDEEEDGAAGPAANAAAAAASSEKDAAMDDRATGKRVRRPSSRFEFEETQELKKRKTPSKSLKATFTEGIGRRRTLNRNEILGASGSLLPLMLRNFDRRYTKTEDWLYDERTYTRMFTGDLKPVITAVLGKRAAEATAAAAGGPLRGVFEWTNPQEQCERAIGGPKANSLCWICSLPITQDDIDGKGRESERRTPAGNNITGVQCEHKLPVVLALLITGLYDEALARVIKKVAYVEQVRKEYAWAHERCNQVKGETAYLKDVGENDAVELQLNEGTIGTDLTTLWTVEHPKFIPSKTTFQERAGNIESTWKPSATKGIEDGLRSIITEVNTKNGLTKSKLYAYFVRAVISRVTIAYGVPLKIIARTAISLGAQRRGGRRGGGKEDDVVDDIMDYVFVTLVKSYESQLRDRMASIPEGRETPETGQEILDFIADRYGTLWDDVFDLSEAVLTLLTEVDATNEDELAALIETSVAEAIAPSSTAGPAAAAASAMTSATPASPPEKRPAAAPPSPAAAPAPPPIVTAVESGSPRPSSGQTTPGTAPSTASRAEPATPSSVSGMSQPDFGSPLSAVRQSKPRQEEATLRGSIGPGTGSFPQGGGFRFGPRPKWL